MQQSFNQLLEEYLEHKKLKYKRSGNGQFLLETCPSCGDSKFHHFYINEQNGLWDCKKCFEGDSEVWTSKGLKPIKDVLEGDLVLTKDGNWKKVTHTHSRNYTGNVIRWSDGPCYFSSTSDHDVFAIKKTNYSPDKWSPNGKRKPPKDSDIVEIQMGKLNSGDFLIHPSLDKFIETDGSLEYNYLDKKDGPIARKFPLEIFKDAMFYWVVGWYIAEGCPVTRGINFAFNAETEFEQAKKVKEFFELYGFKANFVARKGKAGALQVYGAYLEKWFSHFCGKGADNKKIPEDYVNTEKVKLILEGYIFGDGHEKKNGGVYLATISKVLAKQLFCVLSFFGRHPSFNIRKAFVKNGINRRESYYIYFSREARTYRGKYRTIKSIESVFVENTKVYDLTVEDDHTYTVAGVSVHNCLVRGNFNQLRQAFGDDKIDYQGLIVDQDSPKYSDKEYKVLHYQTANVYASRLLARPDLVKYITENRGIAEGVFKKFRVGFGVNEMISIPIYENGALVNIRYRRDPKNDIQNIGAKYAVEAGCKSAIFNGDILNPSLDSVIITEGEFDAMVLISNGFENTVSVTLGAGGFPQAWLSKFQGIKKIYLCYDNDESGLKGMDMAAKELGKDRCFIIKLPKVDFRKKTDVTQYFVEDLATEQDFKSLLDKAEPVELKAGELIKHISEFNDPLRKKLLEGDYFGQRTGFNSLDDIMGGLRKGRLIVLSGLTNSGKTSFSLNIGLNLADNKLPIYFFSLEMPPIDIAKKVLMLKAKLTNTHLKDLDDNSPLLPSIDSTLATFKDLPVYLYAGHGEVTYKTLEDSSKKAVKDFGVQCIIIDHLHYFVKNHLNVTQETAKLVRDIKQLAMSLDIPVILLCHLNRGGRTKQRKGIYIPSLADLRDSGSIEQDADQVLFVCRDSESELEEDRQKTILKLAKNRDGGAGRGVSMIFDESIGAFVEQVGEDYLQEIEDTEKQMSQELPETVIDNSDLPF